MDLILHSVIYKNDEGNNVISFIFNKNKKPHLIELKKSQISTKEVRPDYYKIIENTIYIKHIKYDNINEISFDEKLKISKLNTSSISDIRYQVIWLFIYRHFKIDLKSSQKLENRIIW